jgi:hypothetical protein
MTRIIILIIIFILGMYFCYCTNSNEQKEQFTGNKKKKCPNLLIQKGCKIYLQNTELANVPGVNPLIFENLEQYVDFVTWQRSQGINCPVLFLQHSYDAQGDEVYKVQTSPTEPQGGLPPSNTSSSSSSNTSSATTPMHLPLADPNYNQHIPLINAENDFPPFNQNMPPAYDPSSFYIGKKTPLDKINEKQESLLYSDNAMDSNWGGVEYTRENVKAGKYKGNNVAIQIE